MGHSTTGNKMQSATYSYSPSVPLSVYRELATQLQAAQAMLNSLNAQNQQLAKQNQQLRQEIEKAVKSVLHLQRVVDATVTNQPYIYHRHHNFKSEPHRPQKSRTMSRSRPSFSFGSTAVVTLAEDRSRHRMSEASEVSGWALAIAIVLIIVTAFGVGYFVIRPLLLSR